MQTLKKLVPAIALLAGVLGSGSAFAVDTMEPSEAYDNATKVRLVHYTCQSNQSVDITYGFNSSNMPTYAQANLNGKTRFMPINLALTDDVGTFFGDENNFFVGTGYLTLANYHKSSALVQSPSSEILYKNCDAKWVKKLKG